MRWRALYERFKPAMQAEIRMNDLIKGIQIEHVAGCGGSWQAGAELLTPCSPRSKPAGRQVDHQDMAPRSKDAKVTICRSLK